MLFACCIRRQRSEAGGAPGSDCARARAVRSCSGDGDEPEDEGGGNGQERAARAAAPAPRDASAAGGTIDDTLRRRRRKALIGLSVGSAAALLGLKLCNADERLLPLLTDRQRASRPDHRRHRVVGRDESFALGVVLAHRIVSAAQGRALASIRNRTGTPHPARCRVEMRVAPPPPILIPWMPRKALALLLPVRRTARAPGR